MQIKKTRFKQRGQRVEFCRQSNCVVQLQTGVKVIFWVKKKEGRNCDETQILHVGDEEEEDLEVAT